MVIVKSITNLGYVIVEKTDKMHYMNVDLDADEGMLMVWIFFRQNIGLDWK